MNTAISRKYSQFKDALVEKTGVDRHRRGTDLLGAVRSGFRIMARAQAAAHFYAELHHL